MLFKSVQVFLGKKKVFDNVLKSAFETLKKKYRRVFWEVFILFYLKVNHFYKIANCFYYDSYSSPPHVLLLNFEPFNKLN